MAGHVYVSYDRHDVGYVRRLVEHLADQGLPVWVDRGRVPEAYWDPDLEAPIRAAAAVLVVMSPTAQSSELVREEITYAHRIGRPIVPLLLSGKAFFSQGGRPAIDVVGGRLPDEILPRLGVLTGTPMSYGPAVSQPTWAGSDSYADPRSRAGTYSGSYSDSYSDSYSGSGSYSDSYPSSYPHPYSGSSAGPYTGTGRGSTGYPAPDYPTQAHYAAIAGYRTPAGYEELDELGDPELTEDSARRRTPLIAAATTAALAILGLVAFLTLRPGSDAGGDAAVRPPAGASIAGTLPGVDSTSMLATTAVSASVSVSASRTAARVTTTSHQPTATTTQPAAPATTTTAAPPPVPDFTLSDANVSMPVGGATYPVTLTISTAYPTGLVVSLMSSAPSIVTVPATATVPANQTSVSFTLTSNTNGTATVTATLGAHSHDVTVNIV